MNGLDSFREILNFIGLHSHTWKLALDDEDVIEVPEERYVEFNRATLRWSEQFDPLFQRGITTTNLGFKKIKRLSCSKGISETIEFLDGTDIVMSIYPSCNELFDTDSVREFFITNLDIFLSKDKLTTNIYLDDLIIEQPFMIFETRHEETAKYNCLKLGYDYEFSTNTNIWLEDPYNYPKTNLMSKIEHPQLMEFYRVAMLTADPFHQYLEFYHLLEYMFYEGLLKRIISLKSSNPKQFFKEVKGSNLSSEMKMLEFVFEELAFGKGFHENLDVVGIKAKDPSIENRFKKNKVLSVTDKTSWSEFLYQIRCGLVHTKEGEEIFERTTLNEELLCEYLLPFMRRLCMFLLETK
ncbi:hypothetical protein [Rossellomorea marisflavi]|uniref:hypothetical protein n=1 Tax=Rossellomorea marisflavi TaxID=189381 RepID=UPI0009A5D7F7|nr:hypothetical protein [Rossellomorea marisflavi]